MNPRLKSQRLSSMARASTLNAHHTSPVIIRTIYKAVERMGFTTGSILEPACGIGNFFGLLPESMTESKLYGIELDSVTGRIAKQLYPHADITMSAFEKAALPDSSFDPAVSSVPFGSCKVSDRKCDKHNFLIHGYFFAKTLDQVRPGGIVALITTKETLGKKAPKCAGIWCSGRTARRCEAAERHFLQERRDGSNQGHPYPAKV